jgi:hypothetical protein
MPEFRVRWEIDLDAETHEEAARAALATVSNPESIAHVFEVTKTDRSNATPVEIDLDEIDGRSTD